jgi:hypothetical protein
LAAVASTSAHLENDGAFSSAVCVAYKAEHGAKVALDPWLSVNDACGVGALNPIPEGCLKIAQPL